MKKTILLILILLPVFLFAEGNGGYAGAAFRMGLGARSLALANTGVADKSGGYSFYYNPALTAFLDNKIVSLSSSSMSLDRYTNFIGFSMQAPPVAGFSVGWIRSGVSELNSFNSNGEISGEIDQSINAVYFNFARTFGAKFAAGLSIKYTWESMAFDSDKYLSDGWGWEFGAVYKATEQLSVGLVVRDVASKLTANTADLFEYGGTTIDKFPQVYLIGARYITPYNWLRILYDFEASDKKAYKNHFGAEAVYQDAVALRFGYETRYEGNRFSMGAGIDFRALKHTKDSLLGYLGHLDYAFLPSIIDEGSTHIFSWQIFLD